MIHALTDGRLAGKLSSEARNTTISTRLRRAAVPLALALLIVAAAWGIGGRQGFDRIGAGGQNLRLLPKIGEVAPDFVAPTVDGQLVRLSDLRGNPVWLNFWGSWCPPCRSEFPEMQAAYSTTLAPQGVVVLAISLDESADAAAGFAARNDGTFPILTDPNRSFTGAAYPITNFPTHILIDREGVVRDVVLAPIDEAEIVRRAAAMIAADPAS
jgi:peroxiredoxin